MARASKKPAKAKAASSGRKPAASRAAKLKATAVARPKARGAAKPRANAAARPKAPRAKAAARSTARGAAKPRANAAARPKAPPAKAAARTERRASARAGTRAASKAGAARREAGSAVEVSDAVPAPIPSETSTEAHRRLFTARDRATRSSPVVEILEDPHPIGALRRFLDSLKGDATPQQAQIALGSAQLILMQYVRKGRDHGGTLQSGREPHGGHEVPELVDMVVHRWRDFGERRHGFHAQEFLRNAFVTLGLDRDRIARLEQLVPDNASSELLFDLACAHAVARDKVAMLRAVERALAAGASPAEFRRDADFAVYASDPDLAIVLARAEVPQIPVDIEPYLPGVRTALDSLLSTLKEFGESIELRPPVRLDAILDAERAGKVSLPNDYRALLTVTNGMRLWEHEFFGAGDYREHTKLAARAQQYLGSSFGTMGLAECVPLANWGQPGDWLLYDPRGRIRSGEPGYVLMLGPEAVLLDDLVTALAHMETLARDALGTN